MARDSAGRFAGKQAKAIGDQLRSTVATILKATVLELDANLREATPVDTGHARANWVPSIGEPSDVEDTGAAHDAGTAAILAYKLEDGPAFESNNAPYILALNAGHSKQAPALWIEAAVDKTNATMQERYGSRAIKIDGNTGTADRMGGAAAANVASAYSPFGDD